MYILNVFVHNIDDIDAEVWTLEWTSGTCFVGYRMSIQVLASSADRILQATRIFTSLFSLFCHMNISFESYSHPEY